LHLVPFKPIFASLQEAQAKAAASTQLQLLTGQFWQLCSFWVQLVINDFPPATLYAEIIPL